MAAIKFSSSEGALPSSISYRYQESAVEKQTPSRWNIVQLPIRKIGETLRNAFYLPWLAGRVSSDLKSDQEISRGMTEALRNSGAFSSEGSDASKCYLGNTGQNFTLRDVSITLEEGPRSQVFKVRVFESRRPIAGKQLRVILFSFNDCSESKEWRPKTTQDLSKIPMLAMEAVKSSGTRIDSLVTTSLGNVVLDGLKSFIAAKKSEILPPTLIINRGFTSVKKVLDQLYFFPFNRLLHGAAKLSGWDANPENSLVDFLKGEEKASPECHRRKFVIIEAKEDFYFSKKGRFDLDLHTRVAELGHRVFRGVFYPYPFQTRAHHAIGLQHLVNNPLTDVVEDTENFWNIEPGENMASAIAKRVFMQTGSDCHTCFYISGNDATLDMATVRDVVPLLNAFIEEAQKMVSNDDQSLRAS